MMTSQQTPPPDGSEILPCPWCGRIPKPERNMDFGGSGDWLISHGKANGCWLDIATHMSPHIQSVINAWNHRHSQNASGQPTAHE